MTDRQDDSALRADLDKALALLAKSHKLDRQRVLGRVLDVHLATVQSLLSPQGREPAGVGDWVSVPREPTDAMLTAALRLQGEDAEIARAPALLSALLKIYRAMIAATPAPAQPEGGGGPDFTTSTPPDESAPSLSAKGAFDGGVEVTQPYKGNHHFPPVPPLRRPAPAQQAVTDFPLPAHWCRAIENVTGFCAGAIEREARAICERANTTAQGASDA